MNGPRARPGLVVAIALGAGLALGTGGFAQWAEEATLAGLAEQANIGGAVALDGPIAVVGAEGDDESGLNAGAAYIYRFDGADWRREAKLLAADGGPGDQFGFAVAVSGETAIIGAPRLDVGSAGAAYVFRYDEATGQWLQDERLHGWPGIPPGGFGFAVAIDGDQAIVGAPRHVDEASGEGAIYFFARGDHGWIETGFASGLEPDSERGFAVAMRDGIAIDTAPGQAGGHATVWRYDGPEWRPSVTIRPGQRPDERRFGISVATDGERLIVGSDRRPSGPGTAYVFAHDGSSWFQEGMLLPPNDEPEEVFGCAVGIDGEAAIVGSVPHGDQSTVAGTAHVFRLFHGTTWGLEWTIENVIASSGDRFGASVAMHDTAMLIGCPELGDHDGAAFVYRCAYVLGETTIDRSGSSVTAIDDVDADGFPDFVVGAPRSRRYGKDAGCINVYSGRTRALLYHRFGRRGDRLGWALGSLGDVDGDGAGDFAVGSPGWKNRRGRVAVISGRRGHVIVRLRGEEAGDRFGWALSNGFDVDNDGRTDLIVGAPFNDEAGSKAGKAYLFRARNGRPLGALTGEYAGDLFGHAVAALGPVNRDGFDDFAISAPKCDAAGKNAGRVYVYSGRTLEPRYFVDGRYAGDRFGWSIAMVGRMDGDRRNDFAVGAPFSDRGDRSNTGAVTVHHGRNGIRLWGANGICSGDRFGWALAGLSDLDADGHFDLLASAPRCDFAGANAGLVLALSGIDGDLVRVFSGESPGDRCGSAIGGIDDLDGDGIGEVLIAAPFNDASRWGAGKVHVMLSSMPGGMGASSSEEDWRPPVAPLGRDATGDDLADLVALLFEWGYSPSGEGDLDGDGDVDVDDLRAWLSGWER